jgi:hypothetical protein
MTDKEFITWLNNFLEKANIGDIEFRKEINEVYNHSTILKTVYDTLQTVEKPSIYPRKGGLSPDTGPRN